MVGGWQPYMKWERLFHPLRFLDLVPLSHVFGQFMGVWVPPLLGAAVVFQDSLNPSEVITTIKSERVSVLITVPRVLESLQNKVERDLEAAGELANFKRNFDEAAKEKFIRRLWRFRRIHRLFGWKFWAVISGGATLDPGTELFWGRIGIAAIQGYGLTETTSLISVNHPFQVGRGSIGKVLEGRQVKLDENGEILVRGENVAAGYWQSGAVHPMTGAGKDPGWFHTGDLGTLDANGNLYFNGRQKNVIVTAAGMNVHPGDLERALRNNPEVKDCVVIGLQRGGNAEPCAVLVLKDGRGVRQPRHAAGIVTSVMLAFARIAGESAPLMFTAFGNEFWSMNPGQPVASLPLQIYKYAIQPYEQAHAQAWTAALVLISMIVVTVTLFRFIVGRYAIKGVS